MALGGTAAPRRLLVDGMNVIGSRAAGWWRDPDGAVRSFVEELDRFADRSGEDITVVFDRRPEGMPAGRHGSVTVGFARDRGRNAADRDILRRLESDLDPSSVVVVTSDRDLARRVGELGARVEPSRRFDEMVRGA